MKRGKGNLQVTSKHTDEITIAWDFSWKGPVQRATKLPLSSHWASLFLLPDCRIWNGIWMGVAVDRKAGSVAAETNLVR